MDELLIPKAEDPTFVEKCRQFLHDEWESVCDSFEAGSPPDLFNDGTEIRDNILACLNSKSRSYHYVLPTQLLAKCVVPTLDCHSLQKAWGVPGAFDARTIAYKVIVPFDQANHHVLGGSNEPYVNNPLRCAAVIAQFGSQQKHRKDWDLLIAILDDVENGSPSHARQVFVQVLCEIRRLIEDSEILYPVPNRISYDSTRQLIDEYLSEASGGDRLEALTTALLRTVMEQSGIYDEVVRGKINTADSMAGHVADIECYIKDRLALLVEVKDRVLTYPQVDATMYASRTRKVSEILFIADKGILESDSVQIKDKISAAFTSGQNVYISRFHEFSKGLFFMLGEKGRVNFLHTVGKELNDTCSAVINRRRWAELLHAV